MAGMCEAGSRCLARLGGRMDCLVIWGTSSLHPMVESVYRPIAKLTRSEVIYSIVFL